MELRSSSMIRLRAHWRFLVCQSVMEFGPSVFPLRSGMTDWMKLHLGLTLNDLNRNELGAAERDLCI